MRASSLILLAFVATACAAEYPAKVVGVSDGDKLTVLMADNRQVKVCLHRVVAPETGQDMGSRAKQAASDLAFDNPATSVHFVRLERRTVRRVANTGPWNLDCTDSRTPS